MYTITMYLLLATSLIYLPHWDVETHREEDRKTRQTDREVGRKKEGEREGRGRGGGAMERERDRDRETERESELDLEN